MPEDLQKLEQKIEVVKVLGKTTWNPEADPLFFIVLDRLEKAELFRKTDGVDGNYAIEKFIYAKDSISYKKGIRIAEQLRAEYIEKHG